jgi:hypothetical protein
VYAHEFARARHAEQTRARLDAAFGNALETTAGDRQRTSGAAEEPIPLNRAGSATGGG